jgi:hypothetical protein
VVLAYTDKHPEELHVDASYLIYRALGEACGLANPVNPNHRSVSSAERFFKSVKTLAVFPSK